MGRNTIIINGKVYDATTGLPVAAPDPVAPVKRKVVKSPTHAFSDIGPSVSVSSSAAVRQGTKANALHQTVKKSQTLRRDAVKAPAPQSHGLRRKPQMGHVAKSPHITKFGTTIRPAEPAKAKPVEKTEKPVVSHVVTKAHKAVAKQAPAERLSSRALKEKLIAERLAAVASDATNKKEKGARRSLFSGRPRLLSLVTACFALVILGAYLTYLNMPNLSVRVAAAQAGIAATFPDYRPDGYRFAGPVAYAPGQVSMTFKANGGNHTYTVTEQSSSWDSQAVYDNLVAKASDGGYITNSQQGLTIYTYDNQAAWVNGGILYTIDGDAPLSNEQLLNIAGSL
jgi:hypothetical protein